jgi:CRISPR-associated protein Cas1
MGKFIYGDSKNTLLRHKQHQLYDNSQSALAIAKDIVAGKLSNEFYFSQRIARTRNCQDINSDIRTIRQLHDMVASCDSMDGVRGIEGKAATCYFNCLGHNFIIDWTKFSKRTKNPPLDEINSVLSFLYTLVANRIDILLFQEGLDDSIGYLHALSYGRKSLVFDLEEEFRTPVVDTLACALFNRGEVEQNDFETKEDEGNEENGSNETIENRSLRKGVYLTEGGMKKTIAAFEKKLLQEHYYPELNKKLSYEKILGEQVKLFKSVISGDREHYVPFVVT